MNSHTSRGLLDMESRVLDRLLSKTAFKDNLRALLRNIDPENSPRLVRTLLEKDPEVPLAIVCALPAIANCFIKAAEELLTRIQSQYPPALLQGFARSLLQEVDRESLARVAARVTQLGEDLSPVVNEVFGSPGPGKKPGEQEVMP
ncbi:MAG: hypothetical protein M0R18_15075 [Deltaproteobacteria bacterium]|nr:hypothetical protein [Deltaproteobacteria bacterium]